MYAYVYSVMAMKSRQQDMLPQGVPVWHRDYFELKAHKKQWL